MFACCRGPPPNENGTKSSSQAGEDADELMSAPSLVMINNKIAESGMITRNDSSVMDGVLIDVVKSVESGKISVTSSFKKTEADSSGDIFADMQNFLASLITTPSKTVSVPTTAGSGVSATSTIETEDSEPDAGKPTTEGGILHVEYKK